MNVGLNKKFHWFISSTGHLFYAAKVLNQWRFIGQDTYVIKEKAKIEAMKKYVTSVFGFEYIGYF